MLYVATDCVIVTVKVFISFLKMEGSYIRVSTVLGAIALASIIMNEAIPACRLLKVEGSYMPDCTELATVLVLIIMNEAISACRSTCRLEEEGNNVC